MKMKTESVQEILRQNKSRRLILPGLETWYKTAVIKYCGTDVRIATEDRIEFRNRLPHICSRDL